MEYDAAFKRKKKPVIPWINFEDIKLRGINQSQKD